MSKLILIDGYSFLFRAFFAIRNLTRSDGTPVGALYGFSRMLMKIITEIDYTHIAVVFDTGEKTFRNNIYSEYKANRPPCPEDLKPQFPLVRELVKVLNIKSLEKVGYEADDIIATYSKKAEKEGLDVMIVSSDKDLMQLVDDRVLMYDGMKNEIIDSEKVKEKWGVNPIHVLDVLSLTGDASDNVPGVPGIGPKTAAELINKYGDLDNLIANIKEIKQVKRRETLENNIENIKLSKKLITLDENVPLNETIDDLAFKQYDYKELLNFLTEQEFNSMVRGLKQAFQTVEPSLLDIAEPKENKSKETNELVENSYIEIKTVKELQETLKKFEGKNKFYFNIFTEKQDYRSNIMSVTFSNEDRPIYFLKISDKDIDLFSSNGASLTFKEVVGYFKNIFENDSILKIGYDIKKHIKILYPYNISINNFEDIDVINYILNAGLHDSLLSSIIEHNLKNEETLLSNNEYKKLSIEEEIEIIRNIEKDKKVDNIKNILFEVSCFIVESIKPLYFKLKEGLVRQNLVSVYETIEKPMTKILASMEIEGIKIDVKRLRDLSNEFQSYIDTLSKEIYEIAGEEFNIGSPKQLSEILFNKLKLKPIKKSSKSGNFSTGVEILEELASQGCEICDKILMWRRYTKLKNTYADVLPTMIDNNSRIHTTYSNTYVVSGRLSSSNPNLQNIPIKTEAGSKIRSAFVAKDGCKLVSADYKQAELRIMANYQNVEKLKEFFKQGKDIHKTTASKVFKVPEEQVSHEMRSIAKAINFSIIYGTSSYGLAKRTKSSNVEAKEYLDNYFATYPEIQNYIKDIKDFVARNNYVKTMFGRKINIDIAHAKPIMKGNLERLAINAPIQGTAADIIKKAMITLYDRLKNFKSKMILQIHDELVLECPEDEIEEVSRILKDAMENVVDWDVKLEVDVGIGNNLEEM